MAMFRGQLNSTESTPKSLTTSSRSVNLSWARRSPVVSN